MIPESFIVIACATVYRGVEQSGTSAGHRVNRVGICRLQPGCVYRKP
jgi:hypothetical protein